MGIMIRYEEGRNAFVNCNDVSVGLRFYIWKSKILLGIVGIFDDDDNLNPILKKEFNLVIDTVIKTFNRILERDNQINLLPSRICVYFNAEDDFYTVIFGYRYSNKITKINDVRYPLMRDLKEESIFVSLISGSDIHIPISDYDITHCSEAPVLAMEKKDIDLFVNKKTKAATRKTKTVIFQDLEDVEEKNTDDQTDSSKKESEKTKAGKQKTKTVVSKDLEDVEDSDTDDQTDSSKNKGEQSVSEPLEKEDSVEKTLKKNGGK